MSYIFRSLSLIKKKNKNRFYFLTLSYYFLLTATFYFIHFGMCVFVKGAREIKFVNNKLYFYSTFQTRYRASKVWYKHMEINLKHNKLVI